MMQSIPLLNREERIQELHDSVFFPEFFKGEGRTVESHDGLKLQYRYFTVPNEKGIVVLLPGRSECILKYSETIFDLRAAGYSVCAFDHRGQGFSPRLTQHRQVGYVDSFEDYIEDLNHLFEQEKLFGGSRKVYLLAHSMGAAIATLFLFHGKYKVDGAVLSAPMYEINFGKITQLGAYALSSLQCLAGKEKDFVYSTGPLDIDTYGDVLSRCEARLKVFRKMFRDHPEVVLGGPSNRWIQRAIEATVQLRRVENFKKIGVPVLLLEAGKELVVMNRSFEGLEHTSGWMCKVSFPDAFHEMFIEHDDVRSKAVEAVTWFFEQTAK